MFFNVYFHLIREIDFFFERKADVITQSWRK